MCGDSKIIKPAAAANTSNWKTISTPQDSGFIPTLGVTIWLGCNGFLVYLTLYLIFFATNTHRQYILGLYAVSLTIPRQFPGRLGTMIGNFCMRCAERYFGLTTIIEDEDALLKLSDANKAAVFAFEPHDILPYPVFCFNPCLNRFPGKMGETNSCLMTSAIFRLPLMRHVFTWVSGNPIDKSTFIQKLKQQESFVMVPGGVQEVTYMMDEPSEKRNEHLILFLKERKGFIKLALASGSPVVPVFGFHLDGSYDSWIPRGVCVNSIARKIGFLPLVFFGRFHIPYGIPKPQHIKVVVGKPVAFPKVDGGKNNNKGDGDDDVSVERIEKYHAMYLTELEALYERHKHDAGYGHRKIKII